jgi:hypothetical protein
MVHGVRLHQKEFPAMTLYPRSRRHNQNNAWTRRSCRSARLRIRCRPALERLDERLVPGSALVAGMLAASGLPGALAPHSPMAQTDAWEGLAVRRHPPIGADSGTGQAMATNQAIAKAGVPAESTTLVHAGAASGDQDTSVQKSSPDAGLGGLLGIDLPADEDPSATLLAPFTGARRPQTGPTIQPVNHGGVVVLPGGGVASNQPTPRPSATNLAKGTSPSIPNSILAAPETPGPATPPPHVQGAPVQAQGNGPSIAPSMTIQVSSAVQRDFAQMEQADRSGAVIPAPPAGVEINRPAMDPAAYQAAKQAAEAQATSSSRTTTPATPGPLAPGPLAPVYKGASFNGASQSGSFPPDTEGTVGTSSIVEVTNSNFSAYTVISLRKCTIAA